MIDYIDKHFNPSGTVDSLSHIFDLIDIKQASDEPVITLKARFSWVFASLKMGGVSVDSALQVGFMLHALSHTTPTMGSFRIFVLGATCWALLPSNRLLTNVRHTTRTPGVDPLGKTASLHVTHLLVRRVLPIAIVRIPMMPYPKPPLVLTFCVGVKPAWTPATTVWYATTPPTRAHITPRTVPYSSNLA